MAGQVENVRPAERIGRRAVCFTAVLVLWWALTGEAGWKEGGWWFAVPLAALAAFAASMPAGPERLKAMALPGFTLFFIKESIASGLDVTRRVMGRKVDVAPAFIDFPFALPEGRSRVFFISVTNLLPGTLGVDLVDGTLKVHILDREANVAKKLLDLEQRVARLFSIDLNRGG